MSGSTGRSVGRRDRMNRSKFWAKLSPWCWLREASEESRAEAKREAIKYQTAGDSINRAIGDCSVWASLSDEEKERLEGSSS